MSLGSQSLTQRRRQHAMGMSHRRGPHPRMKSREPAAGRTTCGHPARQQRQQPSGPAAPVSGLGLSGKRRLALCLLRVVGLGRRGCGDQRSLPRVRAPIVTIIWSRPGAGTGARTPRRTTVTILPNGGERLKLGCRRLSQSRRDDDGGLPRRQARVEKGAPRHDGRSLASYAACGAGHALSRHWPFVVLPRIQPSAAG